MKAVAQTYAINAPLHLVWQAFVDPAIIDTWGGGPAVMDDRVGTSFSLWGGDIHGTNTKVVPEKLLEQDWYSGDSWPQPSRVSFAFTSDSTATTVELKHTNIPDDEAADIEQGWRIYYLGPIQALFE